MKNIFGGLVIGAVLGLIGYFVAYHFGKPILDQAKASAAWPSVDGVVERSEVTTSRATTHSRNRRRETMYSPEVVYRYNVNGEDLRASTVAFGADFSSNSASVARAVIDRYPVNKPVQVYYDPEIPGNAVLEPGITWKAYVVFGIGWVFLGASVLVLASTVYHIVFGTLAVAGAATGVIGQRKSNTSPYAPPVEPAIDRPAAPRMSDGTDDGIDIG